MAAMVETNNHNNFTSKPRPIRKGQRTTAGLFTENNELQSVDNDEFDPSAQPAPYANIMYDRRIVRGNTYAQAGLVTRRNRYGGNMLSGADIQHENTNPVLAPSKDTKKSV